MRHVKSLLSNRLKCFLIGVYRQTWHSVVCKQIGKRPAVAGPARRLAVDGFVFAGCVPGRSQDWVRSCHASAPGLSAKRQTKRDVSEVLSTPKPPGPFTAGCLIPIRSPIRPHWKRVSPRPTQLLPRRTMTWTLQDPGTGSVPDDAPGSPVVDPSSLPSLTAFSYRAMPPPVPAPVSGPSREQ